MAQKISVEKEIMEEPPWDMDPGKGLIDLKEINLEIIIIVIEDSQETIEMPQEIDIKILIQRDSINLIEIILKEETKIEIINLKLIKFGGCFIMEI